MSHLYYIPLGRGSLQAITTRCQACGSEYDYQGGRYSAVLLPGSASGQSVESLVQATNPSLWQQLQAGLPGEGLQGDGTGGVDARSHDALRRLNELDPEGLESRDLRERLKSWDTLDEAGKEGLLKEIEDHIFVTRDAGRAVRFLDAIAADKPESSGAGCLAGMAFMLVVIVLGLGVSRVDAALGLEQEGLVSTVLMLVSFAVGCYVALRFYRYVRSYEYRQWIRNTFMPRAHQAGVDMAVLLGVMLALLVRIDEAKGKVQQTPVTELLSRFPDFVSVFAETGIRPPESGDRVRR